MNITKTCTRCCRSFPLERFGRRYDSQKSTHYSRCKTCCTEIRKLNRQRKGDKPLTQTERLWLRPAPEVHCDAALMSWRDAGQPFQGPSIGWRVAA